MGPDYPWRRAVFELLTAVGLLCFVAVSISAGLDWHWLRGQFSRLTTPVFLAIVGVWCLATAFVLSYPKRPSTGRLPISIMKWWTVPLAALVVCSATFLATSWLLREAAAAPVETRPSARLEAIRTGLSVGVGTGGAIALVLAARRQWLNERAQAHEEDVASKNEHDANERRITDLYTKAVEQLGSGRAPVRLGGLYALERLAEDEHLHRQTVVDVLCAYLRMPFGLSDDTLLAVYSSGRLDTRSEEPAVREELQVRLTAQRILQRSLQRLPERYEEYKKRPGWLRGGWDEMRLDLEGARLVNFSLHDCDAWDANFRNAEFLLDVDLSGAAFTSQATFEGAVFTGMVDVVGCDGVHLAGASVREEHYSAALKQKWRAQPAELVGFVTLSRRV
jgi:hypothetical protein